MMLYVKVVLALLIPFVIGLSWLIIRNSMRKCMVCVYLALCGPFTIVLIAGLSVFHIQELWMLILAMLVSFISMLLFNVLLKKKINAMLRNIVKRYADWVDIVCIALCTPAIVGLLLFITEKYVMPQQGYIWV